jgi:REP element-mobilizing transposase RayT
VSHARRPREPARFPHHVTLRVKPGVSSLRRGHIARTVRRAIRAGGHRPDFRVVEFNILSNHVHLIVEARAALSLARGMQGLAVRFARRINRAVGRKGKLFGDRYHARALRTPREVRNAIRYVLNNLRHHAAQQGQRLAPSWIDPFSSAPWFAGWSRPIRVYDPRLAALRRQSRPSAEAGVWLLAIGWRRHGLLDFEEIPGRQARVRFQH